MTMNSVSGAVVDSAMTVHSALGAGLLESAYQACGVAPISWTPEVLSKF